MLYIPKKKIYSELQCILTLATFRFAIIIEDPTPKFTREIINDCPSTFSLIIIFFFFEEDNILIIHSTKIES